MKKFIFDVPMYASVSVEAETEAEAKTLAQAYIDELQIDNEIDLADGKHFEFGVEKDSPIELLDEEELD